MMEIDEEKNMPELEDYKCPSCNEQMNEHSPDVYECDKCGSVWYIKELPELEHDEDEDEDEDEEEE